MTRAPQPRRHPRLPYAVPRLLVVAVGLAGCGATVSSTPGPTGAVVRSGTAAASPVTGPMTATGTAYPVVFERTGGVAGFQDAVTIGADRRVRAVAKDGSVRACRLSDRAGARLEQALGEIDWSVAPARPTGPDALLVTIRSGKGGPVVLSDSSPLQALVVAATTSGHPDCTPEPGGAS